MDEDFLKETFPGSVDRQNNILLSNKKFLCYLVKSNSLLYVFVMFCSVLFNVGASFGGILKLVVSYFGIAIILVPVLILGGIPIFFLHLGLGRIEKGSNFLAITFLITTFLSSIFLLFLTIYEIVKSFS